MADIILKIILLSLGIVGVMESIATMIFPQQMINIGKRWMEHVKAVRKVAIVEFLIAIAFILVAIYVF